jgi:hypothetical protein
VRGHEAPFDIGKEFPAIHQQALRR